MVVTFIVVVAFAVVDIVVVFIVVVVVVVIVIVFKLSVKMRSHSPQIVPKLEGSQQSWKKQSFCCFEFTVKQLSRKNTTGSA